MKRIYVAAVILTLFSCREQEKAPNYPSLQKAEWLLGEWYNESGPGLLTETWTRENDSMFTGKSYFVKNTGDTLHLEAITLTESASGLTYIPTIQGQNDNQPVKFKMTAWDESSMTFENPDHDYPSRIVYRKISADSIVAEISGTQRGQPSSERYPFGRTN